MCPLHSDSPIPLQQQQQLVTGGAGVHSFGTNQVDGGRSKAAPIYWLQIVIWIFIYLLLVVLNSSPDYDLLLQKKKIEKKEEQ